MRIVISALATAALFTAMARPALAQSRPDADAPDDSYCEFVQGVAGAQSALLMSPEVFANFGYVDQAAVVAADEASGDNLRFIAGVRYKLSGVYEGLLTRGRARADCQRHRALGQIQGDTEYQALAARAKVYDDALKEAQAYLDDAKADLDSRRSTAQEVTSTRLRVDELRARAADARRQLAALPPGDGPAGSALAAYYKADADVERHDGRLRRMQALDLSVRFGYDQFLSNDTTSPYFAVVQVGVNLGWFFQGGANARAAAARRRLTQEAHGGVLDTTLSRLRTTLEVDSQREQQTATLVADLEQQLDQLKSMGGENGRRYRQTVWFEWVKVKAEHEYLAAHVESLRAVLGDAE